MKLKDRIKKELERLVKRLLARLEPADAQEAVQTQETQGKPPTGQATGDSGQTHQVNEPKDIKLHSFGSPNVGNCRLNPDALIKDFRMDKKGMGYKWDKGGCEQLGAKDKGDAGMTLAVCGYSNDGINYHVTKFDWISTSRTTRSWENVYEHYNGINPEVFFNAKHHCFFICDKHGNYRTNILIDK